MNNLAAPFRQLVERRLWPLALLLLIALAAVPMVLAKSEDPVPVPSPVAAVPNTNTANALSTQPIVSVGAPETREQRRRVLGSKKDPFKPARAPKKAKTATTQAKEAAGKAGALPKTDQALANAITNLVTVQKAKKTYELYSLTVRFGDSTSDVKLPARNLKRLKAMPNVANPAFIYLGLLDDHKTAVFLVDANAKVQGDGKCMPSPENCQTLHMKVGDIAFFDVTDPASGSVMAQYQLDLVRIRKKTTTDRAAAERAMASEAAGGRSALRTRSGRTNGYRYNRASGTVAKAQ